MDQALKSLGLFLDYFGFFREKEKQKKKTKRR